MKDRVSAVILAVVFALVGAFSASVWLEVRRETPAAAAVSSGILEGRRIRVEVLNGAGVEDLAWRATERLRELGFDVVYYGNAEEGFDRDTSEAIARGNSIEPARRVAEALGLRLVTHRADRNLYLDVTIVLGADWGVEKGPVPLEEPSQLDRWWGRFKRAAGRLWPG